MWFRFPNGTSQISLEQEIYEPEFKDKEGNLYARIPDHLAPTLLSISGFSRVERPEGAMEDLPPSDPKRAEAVDSLAAELEAAREENQRLRQELGAARRERDGLQTQFDEVQAELLEVKNNKAKEIVVPKPGAASTAQPPISERESDAGSSSGRSSSTKPSGR